MSQADQSILNEVIKAARLGNLDEGQVEFVSEKFAEKGDHPSYFPRFTIMKAIVEDDFGEEFWYDLPTSIVDAEDPIAAATAYKPKRR